MSRGKRFESARRLSYFLSICRTIVTGADSRRSRRGPCTPTRTPTATCAGGRPASWSLGPRPALSRLSWRGHAKVLAYLAAEEDAGAHFGPFEDLENLLARMVDLGEIRAIRKPTCAGRSKSIKQLPQARSSAL